MKKNYDICPICKQNDEVISNGKKQLLCKRCKRYFSPNSTKVGYPKEIKLVLHTLLALMKTTRLKGVTYSIKNFKNRIKNARYSENYVPQIEYKIFEQLSESTTASRMTIDADIQDVAIVIKNENSFFVVNDLKKGKKIMLNDCNFEIV